MGGYSHVLWMKMTIRKMIYYIICRGDNACRCHNNGRLWSFLLVFFLPLNFLLYNENMIDSTFRRPIESLVLIIWPHVATWKHIFHVYKFNDLSACSILCKCNGQWPLWQVPVQMTVETKLILDVVVLDLGDYGLQNQTS